MACMKHCMLPTEGWGNAKILNLCSKWQNDHLILPFLFSCQVGERVSKESNVMLSFLGEAIKQAQLVVFATASSGSKGNQ